MSLTDLVSDVDIDQPTNNIGCFEHPLRVYNAHGDSGSDARRYLGMLPVVDSARKKEEQGTKVLVSPIITELRMR